MALYTDGTLPFLVDGEEFKTYYRIYGSLSDTSLPPLIALHGGPGIVSYYLSPLSKLFERNERQPVILYDQVGNGRSSHFPEKGAEFITIKLYVDELANLIDKLDLKEYHILGHSFGGCLGAEFEAERHPAGLKSLILTNTLVDMRLFYRSHAERLATFENAEELKQAFAKGASDPKAYREALNTFNERWSLRHFKERPLPDDIDPFVWLFGDEEKGIKGDRTVVDKMVEDKKWSIVGRIHLIKVPVLLITATDDMIQSYAAEPFFWEAQKVKWINLEHSSHLPFWEEPENYMRIVGEWLENAAVSEVK
ncbi:proline iminopeptidase [Ephemerocybe angulata]|uniref:Proline iminopeptidase n=1 Tax=Ephemerocybe angulata TaxID=980116 RepID=A0A8H6LUV2_9AGAR|nr:proline iminopeptidase [Tulosesus angulatus]